MSYTAKQFSHRSLDRQRPVTGEDLLAIIEFLENELVAISRAFQETQELELRTTKKAPRRPQDGMIVSADGTSWNPGDGKGIYAYLSGKWVQLGGLGMNSSQKPYYVVDQKAQAMLRELLVEQKVQTLILQTKLNFTLDTDTVRAMYYNTIGAE